MERDAKNVQQTAENCGVCPSIIWRAISPDPAIRKGLPYLPSLKIFRRRLIRTEATKQWLEELERLELERQTQEAEAVAADRPEPRRAEARS
jgi:hypothetical protein